MTTFTQKKGLINQTQRNKVKSVVAIMKRQDKNALKQKFYDAKKSSYFSRSSFINTWKPYFPINVINKKWNKMLKQAKIQNPFIP